MTITKTTTRMAERRGVAITFWSGLRPVDGLQGASVVEFGAIDEEEPAAVYRVASDGLFFDVGIGCMEDWPRWIQSEGQLRGLLDVMAEEVK